jgi:hypothetical protein
VKGKRRQAANKISHHSIKINSRCFSRGSGCQLAFYRPNSDGNGLRGCGDKELMECHCRRFRSDFALTRRAIPAALCSNAHTRPKPRLWEMELSGRCCFSCSRRVPIAHTYATVTYQLSEKRILHQEKAIAWLE